MEYKADYSTNHKQYRIWKFKVTIPIQTSSKIETVCDCSPKHKQYNSRRKKVFCFTNYKQNKYWPKKTYSTKYKQYKVLKMKVTFLQTTKNIECGKYKWLFHKPKAI